MQATREVTFLSPCRQNFVTVSNACSAEHVHARPVPRAAAYGCQPDPLDGAVRRSSNTSVTIWLASAQSDCRMPLSEFLVETVGIFQFSVQVIAEFGAHRHKTIVKRRPPRFVDFCLRATSDQ